MMRKVSLPSSPLAALAVLCVLAVVGGVGGVVAFFVVTAMASGPLWSAGNKA